MRVVIRSAGIAVIAIVATALLAFTTTMASARAATALMIGGIAAGTLPDIVMQNVLNGRYAGDNRVNIVWPAQARPYTGPNDKTMGASIREGTETLYARIPTNGAETVVVGMSAGALVVDEVLRRLANEPFRNNLTFMIVADSSRQDVINESQYNPIYDYTYQTAPQTKYTITVVTGEYDGAADFPDRVWNLLAVVNAVVGAAFVHVPVMFANLNAVPSENITTTYNSVGGKTIHYLVPTQRLPLVQLLPFLAPIEGALKQMVDSGYSRNDQPAVASSAVTALATQTQIESSTQAIDPLVGSLAEPVNTSAEAGEGLAKVTVDVDKELDTGFEAVRNGVTGSDEVSRSTTTDNDPTTTKDNDPTTTKDNDPTTTKDNDPTTTKDNDPTTTKDNDPTTTKDNDPTTTKDNDPTTTKDNDPTTTKDNDPTTTKDNDPSTTKDNDPSSSTSSSSGNGSTE